MTHVDCLQCTAHPAHQQVMRIAELRGLIYQHLTPGTLTRTQRVCKEWRDWHDFYVPRHYAVTRFLARWFGDGNRARAVTAECGALWAGAPVTVYLLNRADTRGIECLDVFVRSTGLCPLLDFILTSGFVATGEHRARAVDMARDIAGYDYANYPYNDVITFTFTKPKPPVSPQIAASPKGVPRNIALRVTRDHPLTAVLNYPMTADMSFATSERIVCIFARSALRNATTSSITSSEPLPVLDASSRWRRRNYSVAIQRTGVFDSSYIQDMGPGERYVGDGSCWMIDCSGVDKMQRPPELPVVNCTWRVSLVGKRTVPDTLRVRLDFDVSSHVLLQGDLVCSPDFKVHLQKYLSRFNEMDAVHFYAHAAAEEWTLNIPKIYASFLLRSAEQKMGLGGRVRPIVEQGTYIL